jgi:hypothetical protein
MASTRARVAVFVVLVTACVIGAGAAIVLATGQEDVPGGSAAARDALVEARDAHRPVALFRSLDRDGQLALATLGDAGGARTAVPMTCDRVHFAASRGICLARGSGFASGYRAKVFGTDLRVTGEVGVAGVPSRARVSPDGRYGSVTLFVTGHSYADAGTFSTETTLIDLARAEKIANLEQFAVTRSGRQVTAVDVNFWGVTFGRDSDRFYATMATGGRTYLIEGSVRSRTARVLHENVECPSLSPDGTRLAYKRRTASRDRPWRLTVLDLATMRETPLAETRSIDDQAEWLDDDRVLYEAGGEIWEAAADGSGKPERFLARADSPAVVRW